MKTSSVLQFVTCIALLQITTPLFAQEKKPWGVRRVYVNFSGAVNGGNVSQLNLHFNNQWTGFISADEATPSSKNMPGDYNPGQGSILGFSLGSSTPDDEYDIYTVGMGRVITPASDKAWLTAIGGVSFGQYTGTKFTKQAVESGTFLFGLMEYTTSNYAITKEKSSVIGLTTGVEGHVNLFRFMALSTGVRVLFCSQGVFGTYNLGADFGLMRPNKKNMIKTVL